MKDTCPPPSKLRPDLTIPAAVDEVILKMVAKSRDNRYADTSALRAAIDEARHDRGKKKASFPIAFTNYRLMGIVGAVVAAAVGTVVYLLVR